MPTPWLDVREASGRPRRSRARLAGGVAGLATVAVLLFVMMTPVAQAHGTGAFIIGARGTFTLTRPGTPNNTVHVFLTDLGLPIHEGDSLRFLWEAENGSGPQVHFELHEHPATGRVVILYQQTASRDNGTWTVPRPAGYMALWNHSNPFSVNVSYSFALYPPPPSLAFTILILALSSAPLTLVGIAALWWLGRRRRRHSAPPTP